MNQLTSHAQWAYTFSNCPSAPQDGQETYVILDQPDSEVIARQASIVHVLQGCELSREERIIETSNEIADYRNALQEWFLDVALNAPYSHVVFNHGFPGHVVTTYSGLKFYLHDDRQENFWDS